MISIIHGERLDDISPIFSRSIAKKYFAKDVLKLGSNSRSIKSHKFGYRSEAKDANCKKTQNN